MVIKYRNNRKKESDVIIKINAADWTALNLWIRIGIAVLLLIG